MNVADLVFEINRIKKDEIQLFCRENKKYRGFRLYYHRGFLRACRSVNGVKHHVYIGTDTSLYIIKIDLYMKRKGIKA